MAYNRTFTTDPYAEDSWEYQHLAPWEVGKPREQTGRYWMDRFESEGQSYPWEALGMDLDQWHEADAPLPGGWTADYMREGAAKDPPWIPGEPGGDIPPMGDPDIEHPGRDPYIPTYDWLDPEEPWHVVEPGGGYGLPPGEEGIPEGAVPGWPAEEGWYEHPDWPENVLWHPQYGYHQGGPVYAMISGGEELPVHGPGGTWQQHLPHLVGETTTPPEEPTEPGYGGDTVVTQVPQPDAETPYYSPDDWEYTQRWGANPPPSEEWEALEKGEPYTFQPFVPKTQPPTGVGFEPSQYEAGGVPEYLQKWLTELGTPIEADIGLTERKRQSIYNLGRGQIQGATRTAAEQMRETLGGRGFRAGETGFADVPIQQIYQGGQRQLGEFGKEIAISEAQRRFEEQTALNQLNLSRQLGAGGLASQIAAMEAQERTAGRQLTSQERMFGTGLEWEQSRQAQEFQWEQEQFGEQQRWEQERFGRELSQEERLAQQQIQWEQQRHGAEMDWDKYQFEEQFGYLQERDVMEDLFSYLGLGIQSQQARYEPYWQSWMGVI